VHDIFPAQQLTRTRPSWRWGNCGTIAWLKEPNDPDTGKPKADKNNADACKHSRPLIGVPIVLGMKPSGADKWSGQVYHAEDGKTYSGTLTVQAANALKLEGCALGGLICKTWTRARRRCKNLSRALLRTSILPITQTELAASLQAQRQHDRDGRNFIVSAMHAVNKFSKYWIHGNIVQV
jgi:hypothetical protein